MSWWNRIFSDMVGYLGHHCELQKALVYQEGRVGGGRWPRVVEVWGSWCEEDDKT